MPNIIICDFFSSFMKRYIIEKIIDICQKCGTIKLKVTYVSNYIESNKNLHIELSQNIQSSRIYGTAQGD